MAIIDKFHNLPNAVKKSLSDQMKLLSWVLGGVNGYFVHTFGNFGGVFFIILWWVIFQLFGHYILYSIKQDNKENVE
jgi:hypothetical protein